MIENMQNTHIFLTFTILLNILSIFITSLLQMSYETELRSISQNVSKA